MAVVVSGYQDRQYVYPTGVQIDFDHGSDSCVLVVTDAAGSTVALVSSWYEAHIVPDKAPTSDITTNVSFDDQTLRGKIHADIAKAFEQFGQHIQGG